MRLLVLLAIVLSAGTGTDADLFECSDGGGSSYLSVNGCGVSLLVSLLQACEPAVMPPYPTVINVKCGSGPSGTTDVLAANTTDAAARLRLQVALAAVREEFVIHAGSPEDSGADDVWVVPFGGFVTSRTPSECAAEARLLSDAVTAYEDGTLSGDCQWTTPTTTVTTTLTSSQTTTATTTTTTTLTSTATTSATTTETDRGRFQCITSGTEEHFLSIDNGALCRAQVVSVELLLPIGPFSNILLLVPLQNKLSFALQPCVGTSLVPPFDCTPIGRLLFVPTGATPGCEGAVQILSFAIKEYTRGDIQNALACDGGLRSHVPCSLSCVSLGCGIVLAGGILTIATTFNQSCEVVAEAMNALIGMVFSVL